MKKTIVAAAVAAVFAAPAMADVSISGQINVEFTDVEGTADNTGNTHSDLIFKGSEDLGNGLKAGFVYHMVADSDGGTTAEGLSVGGDMAISLSGDFGTISAGRMEPFVENKLASVANIDASEELDLEFATGSSQDVNVARDASGVRFVTNVQGLTIGAEAYVDEGESADGADTKAIYAAYTMGGLTVQVASEKSDVAAAGDTTAMSAVYKMGDLTLRAVNVDLDSKDNADDAEQTMIGASYAMGSNEIAIGQITDASGNNNAVEGDTIVSLKHSLSKSTSVYLVHFADDAGNADQTLVGMKHSF
jgi:predicted porin